MASATQESFEKHGLTASEIQRLGTALQNEEFRNLLLEYAQEICNPETQARYEEDVIAVERDRGYDVTFVRPEPHYVVKTTVSLRGSRHRANSKKAFINVCQSDVIEKPSCKRVTRPQSQESEIMWTVPHSLTFPRDDTDKQHCKCIVYDCVFHPDSLRLAGSNKHFKKMIEEIAIDAVENSFGVQIDRIHLKYPKMKFKGTPATTILRKKLESTEVPPVPYSSPKFPFAQKEDHAKEIRSNEEITSGLPGATDCAEKHLKCSTPVSNPNTSGGIGTTTTSTIVPDYIIKHRYNHDLQDHALGLAPVTNRVPFELVIEIKLPAVDSVSSVHLDLTPDKLTLVSLPGMLPQYALDLKLPYSVDDTIAKAKFCTELRVLSVVLPVLAAEPPQPVNAVNALRTESDTSVSNAEYEDEILSHQMSAFHLADVVPADTDDHLKPLTDAMEKLTAEDPGEEDLKFMLPDFSCHQSNDEVIFVVKTSNITKASVRIECVGGGNKCRVAFSSIGAGECPFHYALWLTFDEECRVVAGAEHISVTEENAVIILVKHDESKHCWDGFNYGLHERSATFREAFALNALQRKLQILQAVSAPTTEVLQNASSSIPSVKITEVSSESFSFEVDDDNAMETCTLNGNHHMDNKPDSSKPEKSNDSSSHHVFNGEKSYDEGTEPNSTTCGSNGNFSPMNAQNDANANGYRAAVRPRQKFRSLSESCDSRSPVHQPRGILKLHHRSRHLSESSDDACWSSQEYTTNVDLDIPEEGSLEHLFQARKSVHFNEKIYRSFFRSNSSIIGQRQKNQRKERKKREALRRSSESECSETETDNKAPSAKFPRNKNMLNMNCNQNQNKSAKGGCMDCNADNEETVRKQNLDYQNSNAMNDNCEDTKNNSKARKNKSRGRKKRTVRKASDSDGNSSDGHRQFSFFSANAPMPYNYIDIY